MDVVSSHDPNPFIITIITNPVRGTSIPRGLVRDTRHVNLV